MIKISLLLCILSFTALSAAQNNSPTIKQPVDQTDVFAIPLDEDEEEQNEEIKMLEQKPKK